ncbi:hypothetical protein BDD12DRAFT_712909, partial [Trichophaea hybrida]
MNSADWWWETHDRMPIGDTVIPVICASDETLLMNHSGDKTAWPVYLTIGNIHSSICNRPTYPAYIVVALMPV